MSDKNRNNKPCYRPVTVTIKPKVLDVRCLKHRGIKENKQ